MVLWMPAAGRDLLVLLESLDELYRKKIFDFFYGDSFAGLDMSVREGIDRCNPGGFKINYANVQRDAPKSRVIVSPVATVKVLP